MIVAEYQDKLLMFCLMELVSKVQNRSTIVDAPLSLVRDNRRLMRGRKRPLAARERVVRVESHLASVLGSTYAPRPHKPRIGDALTGN